MMYPIMGKMSVPSRKDRMGVQGECDVHIQKGRFLVLCGPEEGCPLLCFMHGINVYRPHFQKIIWVSKVETTLSRPGQLELAA